MGLRTRIIGRTVGLLVVLVAVICITMIAFIYTYHRKSAIDNAEVAIRVLTPRVDELILWNDRLQLKDLLTQTVENDPLVKYAFLVVDDSPYIHTFENGVPRGLLKMRHYPLTVCPNLQPGDLTLLMYFFVWNIDLI